MEGRVSVVPMLSALMFAHDQSLGREVEQLASDSGTICIYRTMTVYPSPYELMRLMNAFSPDVTFLDMSNLEVAMLLAREICSISPRTGVVGFARSLDEGVVQHAIDTGATLELLTPPFSSARLLKSVEQAMHKARPSVQDNLVVFLPAKAGSGATTVALNVAGRLANEVRQRVLVIDCDLRSGLMSCLLQCTADHSVTEALDNAGQLDGAMWARLIAEAQGLHLLVAPRAPKVKAYEWTHYHELLLFVMPRYDSVVVDLPEVINDATVEIVRYARASFIVCTPETPSLILARQRRAELLERSIPAERIGLLVNRSQKYGLPLQQVEKFLGQPITAVFQNDYRGVHESIDKGEFVSPKSQLGQSISSFARKLAGVAEQPPTAASTFLKSLIPGRAHA